MKHSFDQPSTQADQAKDIDTSEKGCASCVQFIYYRIGKGWSSHGNEDGFF